MNIQNIIKRNIPLLLKALPYIIVIIIIFLYVRERKNNKRLEEERAMWATNYTEMMDSVVYYKDRSGEYVTKFKKIKLTLEDFVGQKYNQDIRIASLKKQLKNSNIKVEQIKEAFYATLKAHGSGKLRTDTVYIDTTKGMAPGEYEHFYMDDGYLMFDGYKSVSDTNKYYNYFYDEDIIYLFTFEKTKLNRAGEKRFFLWRWLSPKYKIEGIAKSENPQSLLDPVIKYEIENKRLERKLLY